MNTAADDGHIDLLLEATSGELLAMAARSLVPQVADMATALVPSSEGLVLVGHAGFGRHFVEHFSIVDERSLCAQAVSTGLAVHVADVADDPLLDDTIDQEVLLAAGSQSCTALPIATGDRVVGVIWAHYRQPRPDRPAELGRVIDQIERHLANTIDDERGSPVAAAVVEAAQLRQALDSRNLIGMAKGILMASSGVSDDEAYAMLVRASQRENVKVREISSRIVARHHAQGRGVTKLVPGRVPPPTRRPPPSPTAPRPSPTSSSKASPPARPDARPTARAEAGSDASPPPAVPNQPQRQPSGPDPTERPSSGAERSGSGDDLIGLR